MNGRLTVGLAIAGITALGFVFVFDPIESSFFPPCLLHKFTGLHCTGCGATRAVHALLHGRVGEALRYNALLVLAGPPIAVFVAWRRGRGYATRGAMVVVQALLLLVVLFTVARNIPCEPFLQLAPHERPAAPDQTLPARNRAALSLSQCSQP